MAVQSLPLEGLTPLDYGWALSNNVLTVTWFDGEQVPEVIDKIEHKDDSDAKDNDIDNSYEESESGCEI